MSYHTCTGGPSQLYGPLDISEPGHELHGRLRPRSQKERARREEEKNRKVASSIGERASAIFALQENHLLGGLGLCWALCCSHFITGGRRSHGGFDRPHGHFT